MFYAENYNLPYNLLSVILTCMSPRHVVIAWLLLMQAIVTVCAGTRSEIPAPKAASLAILEVLTLKTKWKSMDILLFCRQSFQFN